MSVSTNPGGSFSIPTGPATAAKPHRVLITFDLHPRKTRKSCKAFVFFVLRIWLKINPDFTSDSETETVPRRGTVAGGEAGVESTGMYSRRVPAPADRFRPGIYFWPFLTDVTH